MIPIKDTIHSRSFPLVTWLLIVVNVLVFALIELPLGSSAIGPVDDNLWGDPGLVRRTHP